MKTEINTKTVNHQINGFSVRGFAPIRLINESFEIKYLTFSNQPVAFPPIKKIDPLEAKASL